MQRQPNPPPDGRTKAISDLQERLAKVESKNEELEAFRQHHLKELQSTLKSNQELREALRQAEEKLQRETALRESLFSGARQYSLQDFNNHLELLRICLKQLGKVSGNLDKLHDERESRWENADDIVRLRGLVQQRLEEIRCARSSAISASQLRKEVVDIEERLFRAIVDSRMDYQWRECVNELEMEATSIGSPIPAASQALAHQASFSQLRRQSENPRTTSKLAGPMESVSRSGLSPKIGENGLAAQESSWFAGLPVPAAPGIGSNKPSMQTRPPALAASKPQSPVPTGTPPARDIFTTASMAFNRSYIHSPRTNIRPTLASNASNTTAPPSQPPSKSNRTALNRNIIAPVSKPITAANYRTEREVVEIHSENEAVKVESSSDSSTEPETQEGPSPAKKPRQHIPDPDIQSKVSPSSRKSPPHPVQRASQQPSVTTPRRSETNFQMLQRLSSVGQQYVASVEIRDRIFQGITNYDWRVEIASLETGEMIFHEKINVAAVSNYSARKEFSGMSLFGARKRMDRDSTMAFESLVNQYGSNSVFNNECIITYRESPGGKYGYAVRLFAENQESSHLIHTFKSEVKNIKSSKYRRNDSNFYLYESVRNYPDTNEAQTVVNLGCYMSKGNRVVHLYCARIRLFESIKH